MISRYIYRAQIKTGFIEQAREMLSTAQMPADVVTASIFRFERNLFFYYELKAEELHPEALFKGLESCLEECPFEEAKRFYIRMYDVFHYNRPTEDRPWRGREMGTPYAMLIRLRPEKVGSYVFYHQQLQEEYPGCGCRSERADF